MRKTKIICTIGPATESFEMLETMCHAGMNIVRLNMSHGDHESHAKVIKAISTLNKRRITVCLFCWIHKVQKFVHFL